MCKKFPYLIHIVFVINKINNILSLSLLQREFSNEHLQQSAYYLQEGLLCMDPESFGSNKAAQSNEVLSDDPNEGPSNMRSQEHNASRLFNASENVSKPIEPVPVFMSNYHAMCLFVLCIFSQGKKIQLHAHIKKCLENYPPLHDAYQHYVKGDYVNVLDRLQALQCIFSLDIYFQSLFPFFLSNIQQNCIVSYCNLFHRIYLMDIIHYFFN